jgi:hypothetical protein
VKHGNCKYADADKYWCKTVHGSIWSTEVVLEVLLELASLLQHLVIPRQYQCSWC